MADSISSISQPQQLMQAEQVPTDLVPLPSNGLVYQVGHPLANAESVAIRSMTAREEDILTSRALLKSGKAITQLVTNCMVNKNIPVETLLAGDRNAILIGIRITGYGAEYDISIVCPGCGDKTNLAVDLTKLPIKRFPENVRPVKPNVNEFEFVLPVSGKKVTFELMSGESERELLATYERSRKQNIADEVVTTRLRHQIISLAGESDKGKIASIIRDLPAKDSRALRNYIDSITPGVELKTSFSCPSCDYASEEVEVPLGTGFFWPTT
jgi:hypothetical protein